MALFGSKKRRTSRTVALRPATSLWGRLEDVVHNRRLLLRLGICLAAVVSLVAIVEGWKSSFPYRLGDVVEHGLIATVDFERVNRAETDRAKAEAKARVAPIFRNDPAPFELLPRKLRTALNDVAQAATLDMLRPETRAAFGLTGAEATDAAENKPDIIGRYFATLKAAISREEGTTGNRIDDLIVEFSLLIEPIRRNGLADLNELTEFQPRPDRPIGIVAEAASGPVRIVSRADVVLPELLGETGLVGKSWEQFSELRIIRKMVENWLLSQAPVTLRYNSELSQKARNEAVEQVADVTIRYDVGDVLLPAGQAIDEESLAVLRAEYDQMESLVRADQRITRVIAVFLLILLLAVVNGFYVVLNEPKLAANAGRLALFLGIVLAAVLIGRFLAFDSRRAEVVPMIVTAMVFAVAYNQKLAALTAMTLALLISFSTTRDLGHFAMLAGVSLVALMPLSSVPSRSKLINVGFLTALIALVATLGISVVQSQSFTDVLTDPQALVRAGYVAFWCLVAGYLVAGSLPFVETAFGVVTDISLLEMSDISHPLLQELVARAPGTYNHSISVASIAEAAADAIGANGLLVRVGAYYHDVGKTLKPQYFAENMTEGMQSRHEHLAPAMSTLIIIGHVKDGVDLANQHNLPQPLIDFIEQHHGTTLVEYFYHEATKQAGNQRDHRTDCEESLFRYPGPKPQTREAGVLMIADAVESASRTLSEPTPKRIETLVHEITLKRLLDGQFNESTLTLSELHEIEESVIKSVTAIYHGRVKYPEQRTA
ncbi:MAG: HDIG domain-containing metalloprotein [Planctomycetaceae bacterium]